MRHITLPTFDESGAERGREMLEVEDVGGSRVRLLHSPAFVEGLASGDIIRETPGHRPGFEVLERGGNLAVLVTFHGGLAKDGPEASRLRAEAKALGECCDGGPGRMLVFSIPVAVGFPRVEAVFNSFTRSAAGTTWWFGNVYDPITGAPLGWWNR